MAYIKFKELTKYFDLKTQKNNFLGGAYEKLTKITLSFSCTFYGMKFHRSVYNHITFGKLIKFCILADLNTTRYNIDKLYINVGFACEYKTVIPVIIKGICY